MKRNDILLGLAIAGGMAGSVGLIFALIYGGITVAKWAWFN